MKPATEGGEYTESQTAAIIRALQEVHLAEGYTTRQMGRILGCSPALFSQLVNGRYRGNKQRYIARAADYLRERVERAEAPLTDYVETSISRRIMRACRLAWDSPSIAQVMTPAGCGKTVTLLEFCRRSAGRAVYIQAGEAYATRSGLAVELAEKLGLPITTRSRTPSTYREIRQKLADYYLDGKRRPGCLVIDEATTLRPDSLNMLRNLHDEPSCRAAVVLADTWRMDTELHRPRGIAGGYEQLRSRMGAVYRLKPATAIRRADVKLVADSVLAGFGIRRKLSAASLSHLHRIAQADGKLRNVVQRLHAARNTAESAGTAPTFSPVELDFVAEAVGMPREQKPVGNPFAPADKKATTSAA